MTTRRNFLGGLSASAIGAAALGTTHFAMDRFQTAAAAETNGYKALVCVFLYGGLDSYDWLIPYDQSSYDRWAEIRADLINDWANTPNGNTRDRERLLALNPSNSSNFSGRQFALTEELSGIHSLFESGNAAIIGNVGPLIFPTNKTQFDQGSVSLPAKLFSHNDQQSTWMASSPEGAQYGWGGLFADAVAGSGANATRDFSAMTTLGTELFLSGEDIIPYAINSDGAPQIALLDFFKGSPTGQAIADHFDGLGYDSQSILNRDMTGYTVRSVDLNAQYNEALDQGLPLAATFPSTRLGQQLQAVAQSINIRDRLQTNRQVFMVGIGGFDSHSNQAGTLQRKLTQIDEAIMAFYTTIEDMGLGQDVTLFTMSDFGRALAPNGDGTDHGWGAHHIVVGGAVTGQTIYGDIPPADFDHDQDAGNGRLIPTTSVEQFAEPLGRWFGLNDQELANALPNFGNFQTKSQMKNMLKGGA